VILLTLIMRPVTYVHAVVVVVIVFIIAWGIPERSISNGANIHPVVIGSLTPSCPYPVTMPCLHYY
jgi:hypothetical protein